MIGWSCEVFTVFFQTLGLRGIPEVIVAGIILEQAL